MKCFFHGRKRNIEGISGSNGLVSFTIPDIGISFRAPYTGNRHECEYASFLALLEFVDLNPHLFKNRRLEIFGDDYKIISQINQKSRPSKSLEPFLNMVVGYKRKIPFTLNWIPDSENLAQDAMSAS